MNRFRRRRRRWAGAWRGRSTRSSSPPPPSWHWRERSRVFCCFCFSFVHFFGRAGRRAQGELAVCRPARFAARKRIVNSPLVMIYIGRIRVMIKKKKKQWRLIGSAPFALRPGLSQDVKRTKGMTKERRASVRDKGESKGREAPARRLRHPCRRHEVRGGEEQWCPPGPRPLGPRSLLLLPLLHLQLRHHAHRIVLRLVQHPSRRVSSVKLPLFRSHRAMRSTVTWYIDVNSI